MLLKIHNPINHIVVGKTKPKKYYLSLNTLYGGIHYRVRMKILADVKEFLKQNMDSSLIDPEKVTPYSTLTITYGTTRTMTPKTLWDTSNICIFWDKMFCDLLQELGYLLNDNAYFLPHIVYHYDNSADYIQFELINNGSKKDSR